MDSILGRAALFAGIAGTVALALLLALMTTSRQTPGRIVIGTPGIQFGELAETYRADLARHGVELQLRPSNEGFATLAAVLDENADLHGAFVKGGLFGSLQGRLANDQDRELHDKEMKGLRSIGRLFHEPIWVFTRSDLPLNTLRDLQNKKILIGSQQSATRRIAAQLLKANGIDGSNAVFLEGTLSAGGDELHKGEADAAILILPTDNDRIQQLLRVADLRLMDFTAEVDAYTNRFPALSKVVLKTGAVEFAPLIPSADITLLATTAALVVRSDLQPALVSLLTHAVVHSPKSGFDKLGEPVLLHRAGEFPTISDPEFDVAAEARPIYKSGELPLVLRVLAPLNKRAGLPFAVTAFVSAHAASIILLLPIFAIALPLTRAVPAFYVWYVRRRLLHWYRQLSALERKLDSGAANHDPDAVLHEIDRIDSAVRRIRMPLYFSDQLYDLRGHILLVRQRLLARFAGVPSSSP